METKLNKGSKACPRSDSEEISKLYIHVITTGETNMIHKRTKSIQNTKTQPAKISNNENNYNIKKVYQE